MTRDDEACGRCSSGYWGRPNITSKIMRVTHFGASRGAFLRSSGPLAALLLLVGCSDSGSGATGVGSSSSLRIAKIEYGRLVDVYGLRSTPQGTIIDLHQKDVLIGSNIQDERTAGDNKRDDEVLYDFIGSDPDTLQPRLFIPRNIDSDVFLRAFDALDDQVREIAPRAFGSTGAGSFSVVPRNAAIRVRFTGRLPVDDGFFVQRDDNGQVIGLRNTEAVQVLQIAGDPTEPGGLRPLPVRIVPRGDELILDPVLLGTEGLQYQTRNSAAGLPASPDNTGANIRIAIALDGPLAIPGIRADAVAGLTGNNNSGYSAVVRDFRSGNANDSSAEIARGFVRDPIPPRLVGEIPMLLVRVDPVNPFTQEVLIYKNGIRHEIDRGDVLRFVADNSGVPFGASEVVVDPEDDRGRPDAQYVRVRIRLIPGLEDIDPQNRGFPAGAPQAVQEQWLRANAPIAVLVAEFAAGGRLDPVSQEVVGDDPRYFGIFSPTPLPNPDGTPSAPGENVSPLAGAVVRFTKPIDMDTAKPADTLFFAVRNLLDQAAIDDFIQTRPWQVLNEAGNVVSSGVGMDPGSFNEAKFRTPHLIGARINDEDGSQTSLRLQPTSGFYLDDAMRQPGANRPYYFHLVAGTAGIRDLAGNPLDLQADVVERSNGLVIPFTLDVRTSGTRPQFENNIAISVVRRFENVDEDPQPSYYIPSEVPGAGAGPNARAYALPDLFGAYVLIEGQMQGRPTTRVRQIADNINQAPVAPQSSILRWCPFSVSGEEQIAANTSTAPFGQGIQNPLNPYGARLQTVWREIDLSLSRVDPFDFNLDVEQMYWAPFASGTITFDEFDRLSLFLGHSERRPEPCVGNFSALPSLPDSGLDNRFDDNFVRNLAPTGTNVIETRPDPFPAYVDQPMRIDSAQTVFEPNQINRFLPLPPFQRPYFVYRDETVIEQGCNSRVGSDVQNGLASMNPFILSPWNHGLGRRAVQRAGAIEFQNGFWNSAVNYLPRVDRTLDRFTDGLVGNIALPLLADFWTYCDSPDLPAGNGYVALGTNGWQVSITLQSAPQPNFRVLSSGRAALGTGSPPICLTTGSNDWLQAAGGYTPSGARTARGDNTFYWIMIDFLKRASVITNGFIDLANPHRVPAGFEDSRLGPFYLVNGEYSPPQDLLPFFTYEVDPPLTQVPGGTSVVVQFRGASRVDPTPWYWDNWVQRATMYPTELRPQLRPDAVNFPLDPFKATDAHLRKFDDRLVTPTSPAKDYWTYLYNRTVTGYVTDPNRLLEPTFTAQYTSPNEGFQPRDVRYVNWRFLMSNNTQANPPVTPAIDTFILSYRFQRLR